MYPTLTLDFFGKISKSKKVNNVINWAVLRKFKPKNLSTKTKYQKYADLFLQNVGFFTEDLLLKRNIQGRGISS